MTKVLITLEISVTDDIADKYPNYTINYDNKEEFIDSLINEFETPIFPNEDSLDRFGYNVRVLDRDEVKLLNITE